MNAREFYLAIGEIDDQLILEADEAPVRRIPVFRRWAPLAACLVLMLAAAIFGLSRDRITFNDLPAPPETRVKMTGEAVFLTDAEAAAHYGVTLPGTLAGLPLEAPLWTIYRDGAGQTTYDRNRVTYGEEDHGPQVTVTLSTREAPVPAREGARLSRIKGTDVLLAATGAENPDAAGYWAEFEIGGTRVQIFCRGLEREDFLTAVRELVP